MGIARTSGSAKDYLKELRKRLGQGEVLRAGFLESAMPYPNGEFVATVAAANEYGDPEMNRPPRPFFRTAIKAGQGVWAHNFGIALKNNDCNLDVAFRLVGEQMRDTIQDSILRFTNPPLAQATILARARGAKHGEITSPTIGKPLIDTGHMLRSVAYDVKGV